MKITDNRKQERVQEDPFQYLAQPRKQERVQEDPFKYPAQPQKQEIVQEDPFQYPAQPQKQDRFREETCQSPAMPKILKCQKFQDDAMDQSGKPNLGLVVPSMYQTYNIQQPASTVYLQSNPHQQVIGSNITEPFYQTFAGQNNQLYQQGHQVEVLHNQAQPLAGS